jgi:putative Mn2+ efflux pump MntP
LNTSIGEKFIELLRDSTIVQGGITLICVLTICYLWSTGQAVDNQLITIVMLIIGYYFGTKTQQRIIKKEKIDAS